MNKEKSITPFDQPPEWAKSAIWYQILVERFYNGNKANDPVPSSMQAGFDVRIPENWQTTPWTSNWNEQPKWASEANISFGDAVQLRRYGGDLQGVINKIGYLTSLGINAIYLNPINDAPSLHKYDARYYHHVDVHFGNDPEGDIALIKQEDHNDPSTWVWTSADKLFLKLVEELHKRNIKVILDFSWNHTGRDFWAFKDIMARGAQSPYKDWYNVTVYDNPNESGDQMEYDGWFGIKSLPEFRKLTESQKVFGEGYEGDMVQGVKDHIYAVSQRWIDPSGDGSCKGGIDGMRLDVAEHVPLGFWREFRRKVRDINSDFFLVGECWWKEFPDQLMDITPWLKGDIFDAVMHYHWYKPTRGLFRQSEDKLNLTEYRAHIESMYSKYRTSTTASLMNLTASHDSPRFWTSIGNTNKYKFHAKPGDDPNYYTGLPTAETLKIGKALLLQQFTWVGAPHIWNGDEMGMVGADDPANRKPLWWSEFKFDLESSNQNSAYTYNQQPKCDTLLLSYYKSLIRLRKAYPIFSEPEAVFDDAYISDGVLAYRRGKILVLINSSTPVKELMLKEEDSKLKPIYKLNETYQNKSLIALGAYSGLVLIDPSEL